MTTYKGSCYCEKLQFETNGPVMGAQICHCSVCRRMQGSSLGMLASFFNKDDFKFTGGTEHLGTFHSPMKYSRHFCKNCGARVAITFEDVDAFPVSVSVVYPTHFEGIRDGGKLPDELKPQRHIFYENRLYDFHDEIPKFADMPEEFGGSGRTMENT